jgi:hypothetical protein
MQVIIKLKTPPSYIIFRIILYYDMKCIREGYIFILHSYFDIGFIGVRTFLSYNLCYFALNVAVGGIIYPLSSRLQSGIYPED